MAMRKRSVRKIEYKNYEWVLENYSTARAMQSSEEFLVGGHRWAISFIPADKEEGFASVHVALRSSVALAEPVQTLCSINIIDQTGNQHCCSSSFVTKQVRSIFNCGEMCGGPCFFTREKLDASLRDDGSLKFTACVGVFYYQIRNRNHCPQMPLHERGRGVKEYNKMLECQWLHEYVFFKVGGGRGREETYCASKSIVFVRCPRLLFDLSEVHQLQEVVFPDVEPQIFEVLLSYTYTETLTQTQEHAINDSDPQNLESFAAKLLAAAHRFTMTGLKTNCERSLSARVSAQSIATLLHLSLLCDAAHLRFACLTFVANSPSVILEESDGWELLKETYPQLFLDLAGGFGDITSPSSTSTSRNGILDMYDKVISTLGENYWPWDSKKKKYELKEF